MNQFLEAFANMFRIPDLRKRLLFTLAMLAVYRLGAFLPTPGINTDVLAQFFTQLLFFLHLGRETKPRWKLLVFLFMTMIVAILVFGSLWIMYNLNYHMTLQQMYQYLNNQGDGL